MKKVVLGLAIAGAMCAGVANACTDIRIKAKDGTEVIGRTMEYALPLNSDVVAIPRGTTFTTYKSGYKPTKTWKNRYGYVMVDALKQVFTIDGMNEKGLSFEYLYLPGFTEYQAIPFGRDKSAIPYYYFGDWVLGNFQSVAEVKEALKEVYIFEQTIPAMGEKIFPLHAAIHDASGQAIVVEFVNGEMQVSELQGVLTNSPTYNWHLLQLPEYVHLSPYSPKPITLGGNTVAANGQGAGMLGMPGDITPSSRFVKMSYLLKYIYPAANAGDAINLAQHVLNNVDIPQGITREKVDGKEMAETTQWTVFKDLTHKIFYYHTYEDFNLRSVDLNKVDFTAKRKKVISMSNKPNIVDVTKDFK